MNFNRLKILLAILAIAGATFAVQAFNKSPEPLYGYALFGGAGADQDSAFTVVSWNANANNSKRPEAASSTMRVHMIAMGPDIYFDTNKNDQPEPSERFAIGDDSLELTSPDGRSLYRLTRAFLGLSPDNVSAEMPQQVILNVEVVDVDEPESVKFRQMGKINMYPKPADHGWAHFDGPLSIEFVDSDLNLPASGGPTVELRLSIFTPAVDCGSDKVEKKLCSNSTLTSPGALVPTVTIEFPSAHDEPITQRYDLDQFC